MENTFLISEVLTKLWRVLPSNPSPPFPKIAIYAVIWWDSVFIILYNIIQYVMLHPYAKFEISISVFYKVRIEGGNCRNFVCLLTLKIIQIWVFDVIEHENCYKFCIEHVLIWTDYNGIITPLISENCDPIPKMSIFDHYFAR